MKLKNKAWRFWWCGTAGVFRVCVVSEACLDASGRTCTCSEKICWGINLEGVLYHRRVPRPAWPQFSPYLSTYCLFLYTFCSSIYVPVSPSAFFFFCVCVCVAGLGVDVQHTHKQNNDHIYY